MHILSPLVNWKQLIFESSLNYKDSKWTSLLPASLSLSLNSKLSFIYI